MLKMSINLFKVVIKRITITLTLGNTCIICNVLIFVQNWTIKCSESNVG